MASKFPSLIQQSPLSSEHEPQAIQVLSLKTSSLFSSLLLLLPKSNSSEHPVDSVIKMYLKFDYVS